ncbi:MAG: hypothetical protein C0602_08170 [Denitrovibrio sp.]|nr:MAG: hypothetical protein C0602_08170 [Denitrovibrio sp.]
MQSRIDHFINDFYADMDSRVLSKQFVADYFTDGAKLSHFGEIFKDLDGVEAWYDSLKAGFEDSVHMVKNVQYKEFDDVVAVQADIVWTAAFRNMDKNNKILYKADVRMDLIDVNGRFYIKNYKSAAA